MSETDGSSYGEVLFSLITRLGPQTANACARYTGRKQETAKRHLTILVENGQLYTKKVGKTVYYALMPNARYEPDPKKWESESGVYNGGYVRASSIPRFSRASNRTEVIPIPGFVCHPSIKGKNVDREWIRAHVNGEYQIRIAKVGSMKTTDYFADTDIRIKWDMNGLNTNVQCHGQIFLNQTGDIRPWTLRTVSDKTGSFNILSIRVHPRYVYYERYEETAEMEFRQQVMDVVNVLERGGWLFDKTSIVRKGKIHKGVNDETLGRSVGDYHPLPDDELTYDHSHGTPEAEFEGTDRPGDVEIMVKLPSIIRAFGDSLVEIQRNMAVMLDIQSKTVQLMTPPKTPSDPVSAQTTYFQGDVAYGRL